MHQSRKYISALILSLTMTGFFLSIAHFHSEGLSCIEHAKEQHYTENSSYCPLDVLRAEEPETPGITSEIFLNPEERVFLPGVPVLSKTESGPKPARAPPA